MKKITILVVLLIININIFAQLPDGEIAPNWTLYDLDNTAYTLYDYLDQGYSVVLDVSATWCAPCWSFHSAGTLDALYEEHGPTGRTGVNANTTNDLMVFFVEGDGTTTIEDLYGTGTNTQGDWVTGSSLPIINSTGINSSYRIAYFPTVYLICPDRIIREVGTASASSIYSQATACPALSTTTNDAKVFKIDAPTGDYCGATVRPKLTIQNYGSETLTSLDVLFVVDDITVSTYNWTGTLLRYETAIITFPETQALPDGNHNFNLIASNPNGNQDEDELNSIGAGTFNTNSLGEEVLIKIKTDNSPTQTSWEVKQGTTNIANANVLNTINIFPNPVKNKLNINLDEKNSGLSTIKIHNLLGEVIFQNTYSEKMIGINTSNFIDGIYIVSIKTSQGLISRRISICK